MTHDLLLFDLDGTISDPLEGLTRSVDYALASRGYEPVGAERVAVHIGPTVERAFSVFTGSTSPEELRKLVAKFRERYSDVGYAENVLYPGVADALAALHASGIRMAVCTAKRRDFAERILERFSLRDYFLFVSGGDVGIEKWQQIQKLRSKKKVTSQALMIGDRDIDLIAAQKNEIAGGAVTWGYGSREELDRMQPHYWFESPQDWLRWADSPP